MCEYRLSIALVTRNRPDLLHTCLQSVFKQPKIWYEVLISDDSSTDDFILKNKNIAEKFGAKYFSGPQKGLYSNRNFIAKKCCGTHIRTMDDDHTFPDDHFKICLEKIKEDPTSIWVIGEYNLTETPGEPPYPIPTEIHPRGFSVTPKDPQHCRSISCGASIYPRKIIDLGIYNNEDFKFGSNYLEYGARLKFLGFRIRHLAETYIWHNFILQNRSFSNAKEQLSSNIYAILALSFVYEKTLKNMSLTSGQLLYYLLKDYRSFKPIIKENLYRLIKLKDSIKKQQSKVLS